MTQAAGSPAAMATSSSRSTSGRPVPGPSPSTSRAGDSHEVRRAYPTAIPRPGWAEQSAADWRSASLASLAELVRRIGSRAHVRAISLTGQCPSVVLVDARGRAIGAGLTYRDNRATAEADEIRARFGDAAIHARTGHLPAAFHIAPKLLWLRRHDPGGLEDPPRSPCSRGTGWRSD